MINFPTSGNYLTAKTPNSTYNSGTNTATGLSRANSQLLTAAIWRSFLGAFQQLVDWLEADEEAVVLPTLVDSYQDFAVSFTSVGFYKDRFKRVFLQGVGARKTTSNWVASTAVALNAYLIAANGNIYKVTTAGTTSASTPVHLSGSAANGTATLLFLGDVGLIFTLPVGYRPAKNCIFSLNVFNNTGGGSYHQIDLRVNSTGTVVVNQPPALMQFIPLEGLSFRVA